MAPRDFALELMMSEDPGPWASLFGTKEFDDRDPQSKAGVFKSYWDWRQLRHFQETGDEVDPTTFPDYEESQRAAFGGQLKGRILKAELLNSMEEDFMEAMDLTHRIMELNGESKGSSHSNRSLQKKGLLDLPVEGLEARRDLMYSNVADKSRKVSLLPTSDAMKAMGAAETEREKLKILAKNFHVIFPEVMFESLAKNPEMMYLPALGSMVGKSPGMGIGTAIANYSAELVPSFISALERQGIDTSNPDDLATAFNSPKILSQAANQATARTGTISLGSGLLSMALGVFAGSKAFTAMQEGFKKIPKAGKSSLAVNGSVFASMAATEMFGDSAIEALGQIAATGEVHSPSEVIMEGGAGKFVETPIAMTRRIATDIRAKMGEDVQARRQEIESEGQRNVNIPPRPDLVEPVDLQFGTNADGTPRLSPALKIADDERAAQRKAIDDIAAAEPTKVGRGARVIGDYTELTGEVEGDLKNDIARRRKFFRAAQVIAEASGRKAVLLDLDPEFVSENDNAFVVPTNSQEYLFINAAAKDFRISEMAAHEVYHLAKRLAPEQVTQEFSKLIAESESIQGNDRVKAILESGQNAEEVEAQVFSELFTTEGFLDEVKAKSPKLYDRIVEGFKEIYGRIKEAFKRMAREEADSAIGQVEIDEMKRLNELAAQIYVDGAFNPEVQDGQRAVLTAEQKRVNEFSRLAGVEAPPQPLDEQAPNVNIPDRGRENVQRQVDIERDFDAQERRLDRRNAAARQAEQAQPEPAPTPAPRSANMSGINLGIRSAANESGSTRILDREFGRMIDQSEVQDKSRAKQVFANLDKDAKLGIARQVAQAGLVDPAIQGQLDAAETQALNVETIEPTPVQAPTVATEIEPARFTRPPEAPTFKRVAAGSYKSDDDRFTIDRAPDGAWILNDNGRPQDDFRTLNEAKAAALQLAVPGIEAPPNVNIQPLTAASEASQRQAVTKSKATAEAIANAALDASQDIKIGFSQQVADMLNSLSFAAREFFDLSITPESDVAFQVIKTLRNDLKNFANNFHAEVKGAIAAGNNKDAPVSFAKAVYDAMAPVRRALKDANIYTADQYHMFKVMEYLSAPEIRVGDAMNHIFRLEEITADQVTFNKWRGTSVVENGKVHNVKEFGNRAFNINARHPISPSVSPKHPAQNDHIALSQDSIIGATLMGIARDPGIRFSRNVDLDRPIQLLDPDEDPLLINDVNSWQIDESQLNPHKRHLTKRIDNFTIEAQTIYNPDLGSYNVFYEFYNRDGNEIFRRNYLSSGDPTFSELVNEVVLASSESFYKMINDKLSKIDQEQDWRPDKTIPEDYYLMSKNVNIQDVKGKTFMEMMSEHLRRRASSFAVNPDNTVLQEHMQGRGTGSMFSRLHRGAYRLSTKPDAKHLSLLNFRQTFVDSLVYLKLLQEGVQAEIKSKLDEKYLAWEAESLSFGIIAEWHRDIRDRYLYPVQKMMKKARIHPELMGNYLYALHVPERNRVVNERRLKNNMPALPAPSGMTDEEAAKIIKRVRSMSNFAQIQKVQVEMRKMLDENVEFMSPHGKGIINKQLYDDIKPKRLGGTYEHYIPLGGKNEVAAFMPGGKVDPNQFRADVVRGDVAQGGIVFLADQGAPAQILLGGNDVHIAEGRTDLAQNILGQAFSQVQHARTRAARADVGRRLRDLARDHADVVGEYIVYHGNQRPNLKGDPNRGELVTTQDEDGNLSYLEIKDEGILKGLTNMGLNYANFFHRHAIGFKSVFTGLKTRNNPAFAFITNPVRDYSTAILNAAKFETEDKKVTANRVRMKMMAVTGQSRRALRRHALNQEVTGNVNIQGQQVAMSDIVNNFLEDGGRMEFMGITRIENIQKDIERFVNVGNGVVKGTGLELYSNVKGLMDSYYEPMINALENQMRLATYIALLDSGVSRKKAAIEARNITVDFNKKGLWGDFLNTYFIFSNASIQGMARILQNATTLDGKDNKAFYGTWAAISFLGMAFSGLNNAFDEEDEDGGSVWDKVNDRFGNRNVLIPNLLTDDLTYFKIPKPWGWNIFFNFGENLARAWQGRQDWFESMNNVASDWLHSFNPLGQDEGIMNNITPTILRGPKQAAENKNWRGKKIYPEEAFGKGGTAQSERFFAGSVSPIYIHFAKMLNAAAGGSKGRSASIANINVSFSPNQVEYVTEFYLGPHVRFLTDGIDTINKYKSGQKVNWSELPIVRVGYAERLDFTYAQAYSNARAEAEAHATDLADGHKDADPILAAMVRSFQRTDGRLSKLQKQLTQALEQGRGKDADMIIDKMNMIRRPVMINYNKILGDDSPLDLR